MSDAGHALRGVAWERFAGQVVPVLVTVVVLLAMPSPVQAFMPWAATTVVLVVFGLLFMARARPGRTRSVWARLRSAAAGDIRDGLLARRAWLSIALASALGVAGHPATFLIAARTVGITAPRSWMLPIVLIASAAMMLPSLGAWGLRETVLRGGRGHAAGSERRMPDGLYTLLGCAVSIDRHLGSAAPLRLELSNYVDFDRGGCDARRAGQRSAMPSRGSEVLRA